jgi:hypothetical protein
MYLTGSLGPSVESIVQSLLNKHENLKLLSSTTDDYGLGRDNKKYKNKKDNDKKNEKENMDIDDNDINDFNKDGKNVNGNNIIINDNNKGNTVAEWTRCLVVLEKSIPNLNPSPSPNLRLIPTLNVKHDSEPDSYPERRLPNNPRCLPNIFNAKTVPVSTKTINMDELLFHGFRKCLFESTWRGG